MNHPYGTDGATGVHRKSKNPVGTIHFVATTSTEKSKNPVGMAHFVATGSHKGAGPTFRDLGVKKKQHPDRDEVAQVLAEKGRGTGKVVFDGFFGQL